MTFSQLKTQIKSHSTDRFYVFSGDEIEVQNLYIKKIAESNNQVIKRVDTVAEAIKTKSAGLLGQSICFVCRDDMDFQKNESAWDKIDSLLKDNTLIYQVTKLDKRSKFYSHFTGPVFGDRLVVFDYMTEPILIMHIKESLYLSDDKCKELIRICESDYGRILSEIDKINTYCLCAEIQGYDMSADEGFTDLLNNGTIYQPPTDAIFKWVDAILGGKPKTAFKLYQECLDIGEPALRLLLVLYQGVKRLLQVQSCQVSNISENTGLSQWEINLVKDYKNIYSTRELVDSLRTIKAAETGIKTGQMDEEFAVPFVMVSLMSE